MSYDENNIFAKIIRGEMPCHKVYEDDETFAFLDIMPRADGHTLVIPKNGAENLFDVDDTTLAQTMASVRKLSPIIMDAMSAQGILIQQFNGDAAGQTVFHLHVHIIPRWQDASLKPHATDMEEPDKLAANAETIRSAIAAAGL